MVCSECGRRFGARAHTYYLSGGGMRESIGYNCPGRYHHNDCSNTVNIRETVIENYLLSNMSAELEQYCYELECAAASSHPVRDFAEERTKLRKKLSRLKDLYLDDMIDMDMYRRDYEALNAQLNDLAAEESKQPAPPPSTGHLRAIFSSGWEELYAQLSREDKQAFWRMGIDRIVVYPNRKIGTFFRR